jgi:hypothetical protein
MKTHGISFFRYLAGIHPIMLWQIISNWFIAFKHNAFMKSNTAYATCFGPQPSSDFKVQNLNPSGYVLKVFLNLWGLKNCKILLSRVHTGFKLCTLMPEDGQGWPKHLGCSVEFNKIVVFEGNEYSTANLFSDFSFPAALPVQHLQGEISYP